MSRLLDRILTSCQRFRPSMLDDETKFEETVLDQLRQQLGPNLPKEIVARVRAHEGEPIATEDAPLFELEGIPVIAADDVGLYVSALEEGTEMSDVVASMAPPFDQFFIEFQRVPNALGLHAWGAHFTAVSDPVEIAETHPRKNDNRYPRWVYVIQTYLEKRKGEPCGPAAIYLCGLAEDGTWFKHSDGKLYWESRFPSMSSEPPREVQEEWSKIIAQLLFPALMALSFMHCKNVTLDAIVPSEKLSRRHLKRHGRSLLSYGELRIDPIRKLLEQQREGVGGSLRKALHLCRGHFKTFTNDAPLLGRATGTYWWAPQMRGTQSEGVALRDYRIHAPSKIGRAYSDANEEPLNAEQEAPRSKDPDSAGRGLAAHNRTQNYLANVIRDIGWLARSPSALEPQYDLAWLANDMLYVCEVKSLTRENEERQLRMATGQIIRYRQQLTAKGHEPCFAVICTEQQPSDPSWDELCEREGIILIWPEVAAARLKKAHAQRLN
jgi:hypothetical protein